MKGPESTSFEIEEEGCDLAVLGVGSFEQHSYHLPLETDFFFAGKVSSEVAGSLDALFLNPLPYSSSLEHKGFAGTITLKPDTLKRIIWDIAESVSAWGIKYLALINAHGGNFILNPTAREWNMGNRLPRIMLIDFYNGISGMRPNLHAGEVETSLMLYLAPEKVRANKPRDFVPDWGREDLTHFGMKKISPEGVWGFPSRATREKGEKWFKEAAHYCIDRIRALKSFFDEGDA